MNNIEIEHKKRNIILIGSGVMFMLGAVLLYRNTLIMFLYIIASTICYVSGVIIYEDYFNSLIIKHGDYEEINRFYLNKRILNEKDRNVWISALTISGDDIGLKKYLDGNALTFTQRLYYESYQLDKALFKDKTTDGCADRMARMEVVLKEFEKYRNNKKQWKIHAGVYETFRRNLDLYSFYISGKYEEAISLLKDSFPITEGRAFHLAAILQDQGKVEEAEEYLNMVRDWPGNSRFKKWLNFEAKKTAVKSYSSLVVGLEAILLSLLLVFSLSKYGSVEKALYWQYGIKTSEDSNVITDEYEGGDGVSAYLLNENEALYCYFVHDKSGYVIKDIYKDNMEPSSNNLAEYSALQVKNIKAMFYKKLNTDEKAKILTLSDDFEKYFTRRDYVEELNSPWPFSLIDKYYTEYNNVGEVENIEEVKMYDKTYYLVSLSEG